jgi:TRAP-type C4-dicarboxylate transport system permease small subunit
MISALKKGFLKVDGWVALGEVVALCITMTFLFTVGFYQVVTREIGGSGAVWPEHLLRYSVLVSGFLGASLAVRENRNIRIDLLTHIVGQRGGGRLWQLTEAFLFIFGAVISIFLIKACVDYIAVEKMLGMPIPNTPIPAYWVFYCPVFFFLVSGIRYFFYGFFKILGHNIEMNGSESQLL